jgi:acyl-CoA thioester hydrolase
MHKSYPIQIRFNDLDTYGHVNNAVYLTYFEEGRKLWFQDRIGKNWEWEKHGILLAKHEVEYIKPLLLTDDAQIELWISHAGNKSFEISYRIYKNDEKDLCTQGKSVAVCYNYRERKTMPIPEEWRKVFEDDLAKA